MRKFIILFIVVGLLLPAGVVAQEESPTVNTGSPLDLVPENAMFYAEVAGANLPDYLRLLLQGGLSDGFGDNLENIISASAFAPWIGERVGFAAFPSQQTPLLPDRALIFQVRDELAVDEFIADYVITDPAEWRLREEGDTRTWTQLNTLKPMALSRVPGYVVMSNTTGAKTITATTVETSLGAQAALQQVQANFAANAPLIWLYESFLDSAIAFTSNDDLISLEWIKPDSRATIVNEKWDQSVLDAVPNGALIVSTGITPEPMTITLLQTLDDIFNVGALNSVDDLLYDLIGTIWTDDLEVFFSGSYASYLAYNRGTFYEMFGLPIDGGVILSTEIPFEGVSTAFRITDFLREEYGVTITNVTPTLLALEIPGNFPNLFYGVDGNKLFASTESGADAIESALENRNFNDDRRWQNMLDYAPDDIHHAIYLNVSGINALAASFIATMPTLQIEILDNILAYFEAFDSATIFVGQNEDVKVARLVILRR